ncbi:MAG: phosphate transporter permease PtsA [Frankiales bacterium]|nr:phosphate transporter permease PtsA [Frankiales bacterium]
MTTVSDRPVEAPADVAPAIPVAENLERVLVSDVPRRINGLRIDDVMSFIGSSVASLAFVWIVYEHVLLFSGVLGFMLCWWATFLAFYVGVSLISNPLPQVVDRLVSAVVLTGTLVVAGAVLWTLVYIAWQGLPALRHLNFYTDDMAGVSPTASLRHGGVRHAVVGTGVEVGIATAIALPLGLGTAVYLTEVGGKLADVVRTVVEAMTALPDILAGLFIYTLLILELGVERNGLCAGLALAVTMVPTIARSAEVVLRVVPSGLREASLALGASKWQSVWRVVLPTSKAGLATSLILGIARVAGETAPLLIVSGASTFTNSSPLKDPMNSLPLFIYAGVRSGETLSIQRAYGAATLLLVLVGVLFVFTRFLARDKSGSR